MSRSTDVLAGRYRLDGLIAAGGVGEVWRAADLVLDRPVAVKVLRSEYAGQPQTLARFHAEARHAASVSHPAVAQVYDYGEDGPAASPFLVMELVDGPSLADVLADGPLDPRSAMDVLAQAAAGLQAAHEVGLVHRDVKPANLVFGEDGQLKITDFGIAYAAGSAPVTQVGMVIGTPAYLAPERARGAPASPASDLYSLGVVGYECLTGSPPFSGTAVEVAAAHEHRALPPLPDSVPERVAWLVATLTAKDPEDRPVSARDAADQAARIRDSLTGSASGLPAAIDTSPFPPLRRGEPAATLVDANPVARYEAHHFPPPSRGRPSRGRPRRGLLLAATGAVVAGLLSWVVASMLPAAQSAPIGKPPAARSSGSTSPTVATVNVNGAALVGQREHNVSQALRQLGLTPTVTWVPSGQDPGTVISVQPSGAVPVGSSVTVIAAFGPPGHQHDHGDGGGGGN